MARLRQLGRRDAGFALSEVMVVLMLVSIVSAMAYSNMESFLRTSNWIQSSSAALSSARIALERIARDVRAANPIAVLPDAARYEDEIAFYVYCATPGLNGCGSDRLRQVAYARSGNTIVGTIGGVSAPVVGPEGPAAVPVAQQRGAVVNGTDAPVFRYFDRTGRPLEPATDLPTTFRDCARSVEIHLVVVSANGRAERVDLSTRVDLRNFREVAGC